MTTSPALDAMRKEAEQIEAQLQQVPLYRRFTALKGFMESYTRDHVQPALLKAEKRVAPAARRVKQAVRKAASAVAIDTEALVKAAAEFLRGHGAPAKGKEIAEALQAQGVTVPGEHPGRTLGIILSRKEDFDYDKKAGFSLKK